MDILEKFVTLKNVCLGLGFFDGVHLGHRLLIKELVSKSKKLGQKSAILTFKNSPAEKFFEDVEYINTPEEKENLISDLGVDYLVEVDFDDKLMNMSPNEYIKDVICKFFQPKYIISGFNHTFGKNKQGTPKLLKIASSEYGYEYMELSPVEVDGNLVSSSLIREKLHEGEITFANKLLGYNYTISGTVIKGNQIGRTIGFPTANIVYPEKKVQIPFGAYSAQVIVDGVEYKGILNYGVKPTVNKNQNSPVAEIHILNFNQNIYGQNIVISIINRIRDEKRFNSLEALKKQIKEDIEKC